jgi:hypothetical protein
MERPPPPPPRTLMPPPRAPRASARLAVESQAKVMSDEAASADAMQTPMRR